MHHCVMKMAGMMERAVAMTLEDSTLPAELAPELLISGFSRVKLLAVHAFKTAVNPMTDGMFTTMNEMLSDVMG